MHITFNQIKIVLPVLVVLAIATYFTWSYYAKIGENDAKKAVRTENVVESSSAKTLEINSNDSSQIYIDIAGAISKPGLYKLPLGSRVADLIKAAGGISKHADTIYLAQVLNVSIKLKDGEKIYIPFIFDRDFETIKAKLNLICSSSVQTPETISGMTNAVESTNKLDVNSATKEELVGLPSIGEVTADKIISGRPYASLDKFYEYIKFGAATKEKLQDLLTISN